MRNGRRRLTPSPTAQMAEVELQFALQILIPMGALHSSFRQVPDSLAPDLPLVVGQRALQEAQSTTHT